MNHEYPHSVDAERQTLATLVQYPASEDVVRKMLRPESFYIHAHQAIFETVLSLLENRKPVGFAAVKEALVSADQLDEVGGSGTLSELWSLTAPADTIEHYAGIVVQKDMLRRSIISARKIIELAHEPGTEFADVRDQIEAVLTALSIERDRPEKSLKDRTLEWIEGLATRAESLRSNSFTFGIPRVDRNVGPIRPGDFVLISAATSRGKSLAAFQGALSTAMRGLTVAAFSLEMADEQLWDRMFSHLARVSMNSFARGVFTPQEMSALHQRLEHFVNLPLFIEQRRGCNIADIASRLRRLKATSDLKVAIVDYLQRVHPSTARKDGARYLEVAEVSDRLKSLALELDIVVVAPVQLNRDGGTRESASCEMDCDFHLKIVDDEDGQAGDVLLQVAKQRQGPRELQIPLRLNGQFMTLEERPEPGKGRVRGD